MNNSLLSLGMKRWEWLTKEKPQKNCGTCTHFVLAERSSPAFGECRRFPKPETQTPEYWCGEYDRQWPEHLR